VGRATLDLLQQIGRLAVFTADAVSSFVRPPIYWSLVGQQMMRIGFFSLPVVGLTAFFTGAVLALQIYIGTARYGAEQFVPTVVLIGILRELGPVIVAVLVAGRSGSAPPGLPGAGGPGSVDGRPLHGVAVSHRPTCQDAVR